MFDMSPSDFVGQQANVIRNQKALERHSYAPELNKVYIRGVAIPAPGITLVADYRKRNKPVKAFIQAVVSTKYDNPAYKWLQRTYSGAVANRAEALAFAREVRTKLAEGGRVEVKTKLVGG